MVDNQHQQIPTYRDLTQDELDTIRVIKLREDELATFYAQIKAACPDADPRDLAIARTHFEDAFYRLVRSVAKPDSPWKRV